MHHAFSTRFTDRALPAAGASALGHRARLLIALAFTAAVALLLVASGSAFAQAAKPTETTSETTPLGAATRAAGEGADVTAQTEGGTGGLVRTIIGLAIVVAVIYGITWILKQAKASREQSDVGYGLAAAATLSLGGTRSVQLVRAGQEFLLLGVTDDGVSLLRTYSEAEALAAGFPVGDDDDDLGPFKPIGQTGAAASGFGPQLMEKVRELTVRR